LGLTAVALVLASVLTRGLTIGGIAPWLATTAVVWLVTTIGAMTFPDLPARDRPVRPGNEDAKPPMDRRRR
jgi:hypothetical protein